MQEMIETLPFLKVLVHDERGVLYEGNAKAVSSKNNLGIFDILLEHTNFITLITEKLEIITENNEHKVFEVDGGILHCYSSKVEVYLGVRSRQANNLTPSS